MELVAHLRQFLLLCAIVFNCVKSQTTLEHSVTTVSPVSSTVSDTLETGPTVIYEDEGLKTTTGHLSETSSMRSTIKEEEKNETVLHKSDSLGSTEDAVSSAKTDSYSTTPVGSMETSTMGKDLTQTMPPETTGAPSSSSTTVLMDSSKEGEETEKSVMSTTVMPDDHSAVESDAELPMLHRSGAEDHGALPAENTDMETARTEAITEGTNSPTASSSVPTTQTNKESFTTTMTPTEESPRKTKQLDMEKCPCDEAKVQVHCFAGRTLPDPDCPCRSICARQAHQTCNQSMPCDGEFGLHCNLENGLCQGQLSISVFDISHNLAKVKWGSHKSELHHQATVSYTTTYRGSHTQWTDVEPSEPFTLLDNLSPSTEYFVKVDDDGKQEIVVFKTKEDVLAHPPKVLITEIGPSTLTVVWDDFRLPSYHSQYVLEYRIANESDQSWTKVQAGSQPIVTVTQLKPDTAYQVRVAVWEGGDQKLELPSEVVTVYTKDGCVRNNKTYGVGDEFFHGCDLRCLCEGGDKETCSPRCNPPYIKIGMKPDDPMCYEKPLPSDPCCVIIRCSEKKSLEMEDVVVPEHKAGECPEIVEKSLSVEKSCLSDCDHDGDCSGTMKCCPSSCGGAVCVLPVVVGNICENIYCGPNARCIEEKMACECKEGFEGNAHDFLNGCKMITPMKNVSVVNSTMEASVKSVEPTDVTRMPTTVLPSSSMNDLEDNVDDNSLRATTEAPFELDLVSKSEEFTEPPASMNEDSSVSGEEVYPMPEPDHNETEGRSSVPGGGKTEEEDMLNTTDDEDLDKDSRKKPTQDGPMLFDGCEFNNITYDQGVQFNDGCEAKCICDRPGHVSCVPRCSVLSSGGKNCREVPDPDDSCCKIMVCSFPGTEEMENVNDLSLKILSAQPQNGTTVRIRISLTTSQLPAMVGQESLEVWFAVAERGQADLSQWNKRPVLLKELKEVQHGVFEFDVGDLLPDNDYYFKVAKEHQGSTKLHMAEFSNTVNVKTFPAAVKTVFQGCFHHNQSYHLGEVFYQGCEFKCVCRENGFIECQDRCEIYIDTVGYEGCDWIPSEEDSCCMVPSCQRRKIPLLPGSRLPPFVGPVENMCVVNSDEFYRVGDIWELDDGCKTKICRCALLPNGTTTIQCQSECPALPPNAHIPTARCPNPVLVKPDGPCSCPYISCNEPPRRIVQPPRPQCEFKGERYDIGQEFHDGCIALCHCSQDLRVSCAAIECPYHFSAEFTNCLEWDIDPDFFPTPPKCCAPSKCKNDGSCLFSGHKFNNFVDIPGELLPCGARCVCVNGNVTCENRCPPVEDVPPPNLPCSPSLAYKGHPPGEKCCLHWMCKEPPKQAYCMFQGSRYLVSEQWEVGKGSSRRMCSCQFGASGSPQVHCKGGCPQIPQRFLLPSEQCARPVIVTPDDPVMCPYVVCNNTVTSQELYNVNVVALNSTAVRVRFTLANILVGLVGHAELHFTTDPTLPPGEWHVQKFSRPKRLFDSPNIEYILNALRPNTTYFLQVKIKIDALQGGPESELFKLKMPEEIQSTTTTTTLPPVIMLDANPEVHLIDANTARISWRNFDPQEKKFIYAVQLKYKKETETDDKWITTPMIHRDVTSYFLHDLDPSSSYIMDMMFTPPKEMPTKLVSAKSIEFHTMGKTKDDYNLYVSVDENMQASESAEFSISGIPEPINKYVHVVKVTYKTNDGKQSSHFIVPKSNKLMLDHLDPGKKYLAQMELYLTNGRTLASNEVEFITKPAKSKPVVMPEENTIGGGHRNGKQAEPLQSKEVKDNEHKAYFVALVVVAVVAAVAGFGFVLLLVLLVRRQASAKAPISRTPSESAYDNPTYKTYDGERLDDKTNGQAIQTTQA